MDGHLVPLRRALLTYALGMLVSVMIYIIIERRSSEIFVPAVVFVLLAIGCSGFSFIFYFLLKRPFESGARLFIIQWYALPTCVFAILYLVVTIALHESRVLPSYQAGILFLLLVSLFWQGASHCIWLRVAMSD